MTLAQIVMLIRAENVANGAEPSASSPQEGTMEDLRMLAGLAG